jgi:RsiW-degrading membrane proteinase PrsW (M82 family)
MLKTINRIFIAMLILLVLGGIAMSFGMMALDLSGKGIETQKFVDMKTSPDLSFAGVPARIVPDDSPYSLNVTMYTPPLAENDLLYVEAYVNGEQVAKADCLSGMDGEAMYAGLQSLQCKVDLPYRYGSEQKYELYAVLHSGNEDYYFGPRITTADWNGYERSFWGAFVFLLLAVSVIYLAVVLPIALVLFYRGMKTSHPGARKGEFSLDSLLNPFGNGKTVLQRFHAFIISPYFWGMELFGILLVLLYLFLSAGAWKNGIALASFLITGIVSFMVPFLWCAAFWYADFKEREPLRIIVTFFLWGCLAALMAIGINTLSGAVFELVGVGFLGAVLISPPLEELFKGTGLTLLSEYHEYNSVESGMVFGFVIGMGFSFIENWLYLIDNPFSADIWGWLYLFFLRSVLFSANHGLYTAIVGGVIGWLEERRFAAPALGIIPGVAIAAIFHAAHNSSDMLTAAFGNEGGILAYCCLLIPLFDYGGLLVLLLVFAWAVLRKR